MAFDFDTVEARGLVKVFGATRALAGVSASFHAGEVTVVEGPNGSGKSTLVALLAQTGRPTRGSVVYGGRTGRAMGAGLRRSIGLLAHAAMVYPDLTAGENLELFARLYDLGDPRQRIGELADRFDLTRFMDRPTRTLSRGQLQRVSLARALVHAPRLLLLDEPSTGLDAHSVEDLARAVGVERQRGAVVVLVTHDASLATRLGDRRIRLERGRLVREAA